MLQQLREISDDGERSEMAMSRAWHFYQLDACQRRVDAGRKADATVTDGLIHRW